MADSGKDARKGGPEPLAGLESVSGDGKAPDGKFPGTVVQVSEAPPVDVGKYRARTAWWIARHFLGQKDPAPVAEMSRIESEALVAFDFWAKRGRALARDKTLLDPVDAFAERVAAYRLGARDPMREVMLKFAEAEAKPPGVMDKIAGLFKK